MTNTTIKSWGNTAVKPITVVILLHTVAYGGIETILINWLKHIDPRKYKLHLLCFANTGGTEQPFIDVANMVGIHVDNTIPWSRRKPAWKAAKLLADYLREIDADILHTHNFYSDLVGWLAAKIYPVKLMTTLYVISVVGWKQKLLQYLDNFLVRQFDLVTAQCEQTKAEIIALDLPADKIKVLISGFEADCPKLTDNERYQKREAFGVTDEQIVFVNVARLYPEKAQAKLLTCFAKIKAVHPKSVLWILGCGPLEQELRQLCTGLGLDESVRWLGFVADLLPTLQLADVMTHPSFSEGVPLSICSGLAVALPVIASDVGGVREVVKDGRNGLLVPSAADAEFDLHFIKAMLELADNKDERHKMGAAAMRFIAEEYSMEIAMQQLESCYLSLLGQ
jgi:glycosyltransferase involved in cell wall biosynthesis